mgnify:CR=1 FL=1
MRSQNQRKIRMFKAHIISDYSFYIFGYIHEYEKILI